MNKNITTEPDKHGGEATGFTAEKRWTKGNFSRYAYNTVIILLLIVGATIVICHFSHFGNVEFTDNARIRQHISPQNTRIQGFIREIRFESFQHVRKGDTPLRPLLAQGEEMEGMASFRHRLRLHPCLRLADVCHHRCSGWLRAIPPCHIPPWCGICHPRPYADVVAQREHSRPGAVFHGTLHLQYSPHVPWRCGRLRLLYHVVQPSSLRQHVVLWSLHHGNTHRPCTFQLRRVHGRVFPAEHDVRDVKAGLWLCDMAGRYVDTAVPCPRHSCCPHQCHESAAMAGIRHRISGEEVIDGF